MVSIMAFSILLPKLYHTTFDKPKSIPFIQYSCLEQDFIMANFKDKEYKTKEGDSLTRSEFEQMLPLVYSRQLMLDEVWPDSILGVESDLNTFMFHRSSFRLKPNDIAMPKAQLHPLFESESGRSSLKLPKDLFRITWRMEFINAKTNKINEEKSRQFSALLYNKGFDFPAKQIAGIPTTRKTNDEGYLVTDSKDQLFHIKLVKSYPYVRQVIIPENLTFKHISCVDNKDKKYYAYLIGNNNLIYILTIDDYQLIEWPIYNYTPEQDILSITSDYFHYLVTLSSDNRIICKALDKNYKEIDNYSHEWSPANKHITNKISTAIFPFKIDMHNEKSLFIKFYTTSPMGLTWLIINLILSMIHLLTIHYKKKESKKSILDLAIIAATGIYGFIAINMFPDNID